MNNIHKKLNKVAVLGPHDRMNYGDFLFPLMLEFALTKRFNKEISLKKYSLVESDFRSLGAFRSNNFRELNKHINNKELDVVIVAGGECLSAKWNNLYSYISSLYNYFYQIKSLRNNRILRNIPKFLLGGKTEHPFIINNKNYKNDIKVIYHAVGGGTGLNKNFINIIRNSLLVGLRENISYNNIYTGSNENIYLVPDSAIIISDVYKKEDLVRLVEGDYIFFQLSNYKYQNNFEEILDQLKKILETGIKLILCPIGTAKGHDDNVILQKLYNSLDYCNQVIFFNNQLSIKDIANLIAFSKIYIGTSLHGVITSMSYGIPYIALNPNQIKLKSFLNTWSIEELNIVIDTNKFYLEYERIVKADLTQRISNNTIVLKKKYYNFVDILINKINL